MLKEYQVPKRIKRLRIERQLTQQKVADLMSVTKGYISRMENSKSAPPVGTLIALADALGVEFNAFFENEAPEVIVTMTEAQKRPLVGRDEGAHLKYAHLAMNFPNRCFEPYIITVPSNGKLSQRIQHKGQELWFVLKGEIKARIDDQEFLMKEGDSLYFNSEYEHRGQCLSEDGAEMLAVIWDFKKNGKSKKENGSSG